MPCGTEGVAAGRIRLKLSDDSYVYGCVDCDRTFPEPRQVTKHRHEDHGARMRVDKGPRRTSKPLGRSGSPRTNSPEPEEPGTGDTVQEPEEPGAGGDTVQESGHDQDVFSAEDEQPDQQETVDHRQPEPTHRTGPRRVTVSKALEDMTVGELVDLIRDAGSWDQVVANLRAQLDAALEELRETKRRYRALERGLSSTLARVGITAVREEG